MNLYKLEPILNQKIMKAEYFLSQERAEKHLEKLLNKYNLEVDEILENNEQESLEFVCDNYNRFFIKKIEA